MNSGNAHTGVAFLEPKNCPNKCGQMVLAREYQSHIQHNCPLRQVLCPEGCGNNILGKDLRTHVKDECVMAVLCQRCDRCIQERALKELKLTVSQIYTERPKA